MPAKIKPILRKAGIHTHPYDKRYRPPADMPVGEMSHAEIAHIVFFRRQCLVTAFHAADRAYDKAETTTTKEARALALNALEVFDALMKAPAGEVEGD